MQYHRVIFLFSLALMGCEASQAPVLDLAFLRASGRTGACSAQGTQLSTHELRWLQLTMDGPMGRSLDVLSPANLETHRLDLDKIPVGEGWTVTVNGYRNSPEAQAGQAWWRARAANVATQADTTLELDLLFSRPDQPDCARGGPDRGIAFASIAFAGIAFAGIAIAGLAMADICERRHHHHRRCHGRHRHRRCGRDDGDPLQAGTGSAPEGGGPGGCHPGGG